MIARYTHTTGNFPFLLQSGSIANTDFLNNTATAGQGGGVYLETVVADITNVRCVFTIKSEVSRQNRSTRF